jgi:protein tyrosine/serine phosphatase
VSARMNSLRNASAAALVAVAFAIPAAAQTAAARPVAKPFDLSSIRIDNFGQVSSTYFRGAQPHGQDYANLAALGVKTVVDLTSDDAQAGEQGMVERAGMKYVQIPMTTHASPTAAQVAQFMSLVNDPAQRPVYVHCVGGRHRTGVMTAIYRMNEGWTSDKAFAEMKQYKFGSDFLHPEFKRFVYAYHADVNAQNAVVAAGTKTGS